MTTRFEHVEWAKQRALAELDAGGPDATTNAFASLTSDFNEHPETADHPFLFVGIMMVAGGELSTTHEMRKFIEGFH